MSKCPHEQRETVSSEEGEKPAEQLIVSCQNTDLSSSRYQAMVQLTLSLHPAPEQNH